MGGLNLLVSSSPRVSGRARREIMTRLLALGDEAPEAGVIPTRGIRAVGARRSWRSPSWSMRRSTCSRWWRLARQRPAAPRPAGPRA